MKSKENFMQKEGKAPKFVCLSIKKFLIIESSMPIKGISLQSKGDMQEFKIKAKKKKKKASQFLSFPGT